MKKDGKVRIRFLLEFDKAIEIPFHDSFALSVNCMCLEKIDKRCPLCGNEKLRTRNQYAWPVFNYETNEVEVLLFPANNFSPVPALISMFETYGTILDRDYVIEKKGSQQSTSYSVVPMDKSKFRNEKAKAPTESAILKVISTAFPFEQSNLDLDTDAADFGDDEDDEFYANASAKELYQLCKEKGIEVKPRLDREDYIKALDNFDKKEDDDWDDNSDETDDWYY